MTATIIRLLLYGILYAILVFGLLWLGHRLPSFDRTHFPDGLFSASALIAYLALLFWETKLNVQRHPGRTYWVGFFLTAEIGIIWAVALTTYGEVHGFYRIIESPGMLFASLLGYALWGGAFGVMGVVLTALVVWAVFRNKGGSGAGNLTGQ
jgi:hypothetical protein